MCIYKHVHVFSITSAVLTTDIDSIQHTIIYLTEMKWDELKSAAGI